MSQTAAEIGLHFLGEGSYEATIWRDGPATATNAEDFGIWPTEVGVNNGDTEHARQSSRRLADEGQLLLTIVANLGLGSSARPAKLWI